MGGLCTGVGTIFELWVGMCVVWVLYVYVSSGHICDCVHVSVYLRSLFAVHVIRLLKPCVVGVWQIL